MTDYTPEDEAVAEDMARQGLLGRGTVEVRRKVAARLQAARSQGREAGLEEAAYVLENDPNNARDWTAEIRALKSEPSRLEVK